MQRNHDESSRNSERERWLARIRVDYSCFATAPAEWRADREVALAAVNHWSFNIKYTSPDLRDDEEIVLAAVRACGTNLQHASPRLQANRMIVMAAINNIGYALEYASPQFQRDRVIVMAAVNENGYALCCASTELQADYEIVMAAMNTHGYAIRFASSELQRDRAIAMAAVNQNGYALRYVPTELCADRHVVLAAVNKNGEALQFASEELKADEELVLSAIRDSPTAFQHAASTLRGDATNFVPRAISAGNCRVLCHASQDIKDDLQAIANKFDTFTESQTFLQDSLQVHAAFMEFLCCVVSKSAAAAGNPVTMVNLDKETSEKLHCRIAEYTGVALGSRLESVRLVKRTMPIMEAVFENSLEQNLRLLHESCEDNDDDIDDY